MLITRNHQIAYFLYILLPFMGVFSASLTASSKESGICKGSSSGKFSLLIVRFLDLVFLALPIHQSYA
jgi:hypothetical protein